MAKKGGVQQLQADINSDEDLEKFCERQGLLVLDVYSEWCGPCLGMVSSLKKIKLELGGDNLHLAICKSDTIEALERFRNKSEPTWLFVTQSKAINIMFGTNVPNLMRLITFELERLKNDDKDFYDIRDLQPIEQERFAVIQLTAEKAKEIEECEAKKDWTDYLDYCTNEIMNYINGFGVTLFGPQVNRDHMKKILDIGEKDGISCKDRKTTILLPENVEILFYATDNPINFDAIEQMYNKELIICYWKVSDADKDRVEELMGKFVQKLTTPHDVVNDESGDVITIPAFLTPFEMKVIAEKLSPSPEEKLKSEVENDENLDDDILAPVLENIKIGNEENNKPKNNEIPETVIKPSTYLRTIIIPPIWTPDNKRTTAAAIYTHFRNQTSTFLPPDPIPSPPHLIMIFDAYKRKEINDIREKFIDEILAYGYFTNQDPETAQLLANSTKSYLKRQPNVTDKLVVKVAKRTIDVILALAALCPSYVSPNTVIGKTEALHFFPNDYSNEDENDETGDNQEKDDDKDDDGEGFDATDDDNENPERTNIKVEGEIPNTTPREPNPVGDSITNNVPTSTK